MAAFPPEDSPLEVCDIPASTLLPVADGNELEVEESRAKI
jgi:hypothetical protein